MDSAKLRMAILYHRYGLLLLLGLAHVLLTGCGLRTEPSRQEAEKLLGTDLYQIEGLVGGFPIHSNKQTFVGAPEFVCSMQPIEVSGVRNPSPAEAIVKFYWEPGPLPSIRNYGRPGDTEGMRAADCAEFPPDKYRGEATLTKWDDGWRLESVKMLVDTSLHLMSDTVIFEFTHDGRSKMVMGPTASVVHDLRKWSAAGKIGKP